MTAVRSGDRNDTVTAVHIHAPPVRQQHRQHRAEDIDDQRAGVEEDAVAVGPEEVHQQFDQIHRLGVAHDAAVDQNGVAAEEAAHGAERQMAVQIDVIVMGKFFHEICPLFCKHGGYQYSTAAGKDKGEFSQKRGRRAHIRVDIGKVCGKIRL
mgnify:CR=1 FL=1